MRATRTGIGLQLISSNRIESLQQHLGQFLSSRPLSDPFAREVIIVPGMAMARWLNLQLAQAQGVAANIHYPLPAAWLWQLGASLLPNVPEHDPLSREAAAWKIRRTLPELLPRDEFRSLRRYLSDDEDGLKAWQLSLRIADVFDRYQFYRPDWVQEWSGSGSASRHEAEFRASADFASGRKTEARAWQALLWRELIHGIEDQHRVALMQQLLSTLSAHSSHSSHSSGYSSEHSLALLPALPERISLFALSSLPPLFIRVLQALSSHTQLVLFQHSPTDQYWADLKSKKHRSRIRLKDPDAADYYETGNDLLASWGRQGQAFQDLLLDDDGLSAAQWEHYEAPGADTLLHRIQQDIFSVEESSHQIEPDASLQVNICHSPFRECQVLHDCLLLELENNPGLKAEDILVMVPEISRYAPYIEAVFRKDPGNSKPYIPWNLSDTTVADEHPLIRIFLQLLDLPSSRFTCSDVLAYLDVPEIMQHFGLEEYSREDIRLLLEQSNVRWGLDEEHKQELELPPTVENTWKQAEQRLLAGYALGEVEYWQGTAPLPGVEGGRAENLGRFLLMFDCLRSWRRRLREERSAEQWQLDLNCLLEDFFGTDTDNGSDEEDKLQQIRDAVDELQRMAEGQSLSRELASSYLTEQLSERSARGRFFSGGITFCGMRPMRSLPFQVICLLGMNDLAFPRREHSLEFDIMADNWRQGDPRKGDEDRYLILETLLCARRKLLISYTGRSLKDNSECQPSVLLRELLDFVDLRYSCATGDGSISDLITTEYPMQPFSPRNFFGAAAYSSFDGYWCSVARIIANRDGSEAEQRGEDWPAFSLPAIETGDIGYEVALSHLRRFLQHPIKVFFNSRLKLYLREEQSNEDEEPFSLNGLQQWQIRKRLAEEWLQDADTASGRHDLSTILKAQGFLPHGVRGQIEFDGVNDAVQDLLEQLEPYRSLRPEPRLVDLALAGGRRLSGQINHYLPGRGLLHYTPSSLKGKNVLALWVDHLALCASRQLPEDEASLLFCRDRSYRFEPVAAELAVEQLEVYVDLYETGLNRPLPAFPGASYAWALKADDEDKAMKAAIACWRTNDYSTASVDLDDPYIQLALRGVDGEPLKSQEFASTAEALFRLAIAQGEKI